MNLRGNFGGVRKMFLKYLSVRCARKDTKLAQVRLASIRAKLISDPRALHSHTCKSFLPTSQPTTHDHDQDANQAQRDDFGLTSR